MANFTFSNASGGDWSLNSNWSPASLPGSNDSVSFASGTYTSIVDGSPWTIQSLDVNVTTVTLDVDVDLMTSVLSGNLGEIVVDSSATLTVGSLNSSSGEINVSDNGVLTVQNLNGNYGNIVAGNTGLVNLQGNGSGNFTVAGGTLAIAGNFNGSGIITMDAGTMWLAGQLGNASYNLGGFDQVFLDAPQATTNNAFTGASQGDSLGIKGVTISTANYSGTTLTLNTSGGTYTFTNITLAPGEVTDATLGTETFQGNSYGTITLACFAEGTRINTPNGPVAVESLLAGQPVLTAAGLIRPVRWIGVRRLDLRRHPDPALAQPIRILADSFAPGVPCRDLLVSPDHALFIYGMLIPARLLANGATIRRVDECNSITYYHVELDSHDVLMAEGLAAESYLDTGNRGMFENADLPLILHPDFGESNDQIRRETESCAPFVTDAARVQPVWQELAERAAELGLRLPEVATTDDPDLRLEFDGKLLKPAVAQSGRYVFVLPGTNGRVRLISHRMALQPWIDDHRQLGVMVRRLSLRRDENLDNIPLDHPDIGKGWWAMERDAHTHWRWTSGAAELTLQPGGPALLEVDIGTMLAYRAPSVRSRNIDDSVNSRVAV